MNKLYTFAAVLPVVLGISGAVAIAVPASAATNCTVKSVGSKNTAGNSDSRFVLNADGTVSAAFTVTGDNTCMLPVTMASWQAPDAAKGQPYDQQKLFKHVTETFGVGTHKLTVQAPDCFYQIDLVRGTSPTGPNGGAVYTKGSLMGSLHGGTKSCVETPETPTTSVTPETPTTLPNAGTGTNVVVAAITAGVLGTAFQYIRKVRLNRSLS